MIARKRFAPKARRDRNAELRHAVALLSYFLAVAEDLDEFAGSEVSGNRTPQNLRALRRVVDLADGSPITVPVGANDAVIVHPDGSLDRVPGESVAGALVRHGTRPARGPAHREHPAAEEP